LPTFGKAPSHPIMYNPDYMSDEMVVIIQNAFSDMSSNPDDVEILQDVMSTPGITIINTQDHLGNYGSLIEDVPGITAYFNDKYD
jgi:ABC-type phosphate/phosphonate transport system substrate-binding protein